MEENLINKENIQTTISSKFRLSWFYKIICWCSRARLYLLEKCPADYNKFFGIGVIVIMTGVMASISGEYALFTIFNNYTITIIFGVIWGVNELKIEKWREKELQRIKENIDKVVEPIEILTNRDNKIYI